MREELKEFVVSFNLLRSSLNLLQIIFLNSEWFEYEDNSSIWELHEKTGQTWYG